jgi:hypothetical protein
MLNNKSRWSLSLFLFLLYLQDKVVGVIWQLPLLVIMLIEGQFWSHIY